MVHHGTSQLNQSQIDFFNFQESAPSVCSDTLYVGSAAAADFSKESVVYFNRGICENLVGID